jgi:hypothetical protein
MSEEIARDMGKLLPERAKGLPCHGCAYRTTVPGDAHIRCTFDWPIHDVEGLIAMFRTPRTAKWFRFPFNYDPLWGPDACPQRAATADPVKVAKPNPWADLVSLLR